jgi:hypothetical protein
MNRRGDSGLCPAAFGRRPERFGRFPFAHCNLFGSTTTLSQDLSSSVRWSAGHCSRAGDQLFAEYSAARHDSRAAGGSQLRYQPPRFSGSSRGNRVPRRSGPTIPTTFACGERIERGPGCAVPHTVRARPRPRTTCASEGQRILVSVRRFALGLGLSTRDTTHSRMTPPDVIHVRVAVDLRAGGVAMRSGPEQSVSVRRENEGRRLLADTQLRNNSRSATGTLDVIDLRLSGRRGPALPAVRSVWRLGVRARTARAAGTIRPSAAQQGRLLSAR